MERSYIAFISYRHKPLDTAVATRLHRMIERYRVPKEYRKDANPHMGIVFRDRDELPLSNDLTAELCRALDHSEYLIVVCTPDTPASPWVEREIEYFLQKHDRRHVLAVLAAGLPEQSFPPRLTEVYGEDGVTVVQHVEPLAANISAQANEQNPLTRRMPQKAEALWRLRSEFLRLAAALLGCPYDALRQRQKLYKQRQFLALATAAAALSVGFSATLAAKNAVITAQNQEITEKNEQISQKNEEISARMREAQSNESYALSLLSGQLLQQGDRIGALETALNALPSAGEDRPYRLEAEKALGDALYLYRQDTMLPVCRVEQNTEIDRIKLSEDGSRLFLLDGRNILHCYSTSSGKQLWEREKPFFAYRFFAVTRDNRILGATSDELTRLDAETGQTLQEYEWQGEHSDEITEAALTPDQQKILGVYFGEDKEYKSEWYGVEISLCDLNTGDFLWNLSEEIDREETSYYKRYEETEVGFSPDGSRWFALMEVKSYEEDWRHGVLLLGDAGTGALLKRLDFSIEETSVIHSCISCAFLPDNSLQLVWCDKKTQHVELYRAGDYEQVYSIPYEEEIEGTISESFLTYYNDSGKYEYFYWICGNQKMTIRAEDGHLSSYDSDRMDAPFVAWGLDEENHKFVRVIQQNGKIVQFYGNHLLCDTGLTPEKVAFSGWEGGAVAIVPEDQPNCALVYKIIDREENKLALPEEVELDRYDRVYSLPDGSQLLLLNGDGNVLLYDTQAGELVKTIELEETYRTYLDAASPEGDLLLYYADYSQNKDWEKKILSLNWETGEKETPFYAIPEQFQIEYSFDFQKSSPFREGAAGTTVWIDNYAQNIFYWQGGEGPFFIDRTEEEEKGKKVKYISGRKDKFLSVGNNGYFVLETYTKGNSDNLLYSDMDSFAVYSLESKTWNYIENPDPWRDWVPTCTADVQPWFAAVGGDEVCRVIDLQTGEIVSQSEVGISPDSILTMQFVDEDSLLFLCHDGGWIDLLDTKDAGLLFSTRLQGVEGEGKTQLILQTDEVENTLYIAESRGGITGLCIDKETWQIKEELPGLTCFFPRTRQVACRGEDGVFLYPVYSLEELQGQARAILGQG